MILGVALALVAIGICYDALHRMRDPELLGHPGMLALLVALVSVVSKEIIYHYTVRAARRLRSNMTSMVVARASSIVSFASETSVPEASAISAARKSCTSLSSSESVLVRCRRLNRPVLPL